MGESTLSVLRRGGRSRAGGPGLSRTPRLFLPPTAFSPTGERLELPKDADHYLRRVLRLSSGGLFVALDGAGRSALFRLTDEPRGAELDRAQWPSAPNPLPSLSVGLALVKGTRFESALEALAELGVADLTPLLTERTERKQPSESRMGRWRQIASSGSALSGRLLPLQLHPPTHLTKFVEKHRGRRMLFGQHAGGQLAALTGSLADAVLLVGPEGGFTPAEQQTLEQSGAQGVTLGALNLRVETAAVAFVARVQERFGGNLADLHDT